MGVEAAVAVVSDPAGQYVDVDVDAGIAVADVARCPAVVPWYGLDALGVPRLGPQLRAEEIDTIEVDGDDQWVVTMLDGYADSVGDGVGAAGTYTAAGLCPVTVENGAGPCILGDEVMGGTGSIVRPPLATVSFGASRGQFLEAASCYCQVTTAGNALVAVVAYDPTGPVSIVSVERVDTDTTRTAFTLIESVTVGGSSGTKLATYRLYNQPVTAAGSIVEVTFTGAPNRGIVAAAEVQGCLSSPLDVSVTASGSDALPSTAASADTAAANEVAIYALLASGAFDATTLPLDPDGVVRLDLAYNQYGGTSPQDDPGIFTLFMWRQNFIAVTNIGFATTLTEARDWAVAIHSFK